MNHNDKGRDTMEQYIDNLYDQDVDLQRVLDSIQAHDMPQISVPAGYGRMLTILVKMSHAKRVLEIGALGGYSGICLARGLGDDGTLLSLELKSEYADVARANLQSAGLGDKVSYQIGDAKQSLQQLIEAGEQFDFFFIDADKGAYPFYLQSALQLAVPGAIIVADNILQRGRVKDEQVTSPSVQAIREFNRLLTSDPRLDSTILPAYDGIAIARVK